MSFPWPAPVRLNEIGRSGRTITVDADGSARARIAKDLGLEALHAFSAEVELKPWLDGAELTARWSAVIAQICGVTVETFDTALEGAFTVRCLPEGSPNAPEEDAEALIDPEGDDPPDVLEQPVIDVGAYLIEHLALEIDPFPRKPGAVFEPREPETPASPFAVLKAFPTRPPNKSD